MGVISLHVCGTGVVWSEFTNQKSVPVLEDDDVEPDSDPSATALRSCSNDGSKTSNPEESAGKEPVVILSLERISEISPVVCCLDQNGSARVAGWDRWNTDQSLALRNVIYALVFRLVFAKPTKIRKTIMEKTDRKRYLIVLPRNFINTNKWYKTPEIYRLSNHYQHYLTPWKKPFPSKANFYVKCLTKPPKRL